MSVLKFTAIFLILCPLYGNDFPDLSKFTDWKIQQNRKIPGFEEARYSIPTNCEPNPTGCTLDMPQATAHLMITPKVKDPNGLIDLYDPFKDAIKNDAEMFSMDDPIRTCMESKLVGGFFFGNSRDYRYQFEMDAGETVLFFWVTFSNDDRLSEQWKKNLAKNINSVAAHFYGSTTLMCDLQFSRGYFEYGGYPVKLK